MDNLPKDKDVYPIFKAFKELEKKNLEKSKYSAKDLIEPAVGFVVASAFVGCATGAIRNSLLGMNKLNDFVMQDVGYCVEASASIVLGFYVFKNLSNKYKIKKVNKQIAYLDKKIQENKAESDLELGHE